MNELKVHTNVGSDTMTDWANEPEITELTQLCKDAQIDCDTHIGTVDGWLSNMYIKKKSGVAKGCSSVAPKLIRKQAEWRYSSLSDPFLSTPDVFNIAPKTAGDKKRAEQNQMILNNQFNTQIDKVAFFDECVRDLVDIGTAIVKVGWDSEEEEVTTVTPVYNYIPTQNPAQAEEYTQLLQMQQQDPEAYADYSTPGLDEALRIFATTQVMVIPEQVGEEEITEIKETKNIPTVELCNYNNVIIAPAGEFVEERFKTSLSALKKDGKYTNLDQINIEGASPLHSEDFENSKDNESFNFTDKTRKQFVVHTYWGEWDIDDSGVTKAIVASWVGNVMIRLEENPYPDKKPPFVVIKYMPVRNSEYGEPDGELLSPNQDIIGAVTRGAMDLMGKSANAQQGTRKDLLDTTNLRKFRRGDDYEFNAAVDPRQGFYTHVYPEIPGSVYNMIEMQNAEAESLTGVKAFHSGISGKGYGDVATGVRGALDASSKRELSILRRLASGVIKIGHKIISMNAVFLSDEEVIRVTDSEFIQIRRDDLAGKFDLTLSISTAEEDNKKAEELAFMLQTTGNTMDQEMTLLILSEIARLRKMPVLAEKFETYEPTPDPATEMKIKLELALLEAEVAKEQAAAEKNKAEAQLMLARAQKEMAQAQLNSSKTGTEQAKTRQLSSTADQADLDFVEQQEGVHQERELEQLQTKHSNVLDQQNSKADLDMAQKLTEKSLENNSSNPK